MDASVFKCAKTPQSSVTAAPGSSAFRKLVVIIASYFNVHFGFKICEYAVGKKMLNYHTLTGPEVPDAVRFRPFRISVISNS